MEESINTGIIIRGVITDRNPNLVGKAPIPCHSFQCRGDVLPGMGPSLVTEGHKPALILASLIKEVGEDINEGSLVRGRPEVEAEMY